MARRPRESTAGAYMSAAVVPHAPCSGRTHVAVVVAQVHWASGLVGRLSAVRGNFSGGLSRTGDSHDAVLPPFRRAIFVAAVCAEGAVLMGPSLCCCWSRQTVRELTDAGSTSHKPKRGGRLE